MGAMSGDRRAVVGLLTDFGERDPYVAAMKGVIAVRCDAHLVDLSHQIAPQDVFGAAWFLRSIIPWWRPVEPDHPSVRPVIVAVVDPGVGTGRRILAAEQDGVYFTAPDNGLLSLVLGRDAAVVSVRNEGLFLPEGSATFHGRDRFAPVAAALARGVPLGELGSAMARSEIVEVEVRTPRYDQEPIEGEVIAIDRFGNVITNLELARIDAIGTRELVVGDTVIGDFRTTYEEAPEGTPFMIVGSQKTVEVSLRQASAADFLQIGRFDRVVLRRRT